MFDGISCRQKSLRAHDCVFSLQTQLFVLRASSYPARTGMTQLLIMGRPSFGVGCYCSIKSTYGEHSGEEVFRSSKHTGR